MIIKTKMEIFNEDDDVHLLFYNFNSSLPTQTITNVPKVVAFHGQDVDFSSNKPINASLIDWICFDFFYYDLTMPGSLHICSIY